MIGTLLKYRWKNILHQPLLFLMILFFPFVLIGLVGVGFFQYFQGQTEQIQVAVVDEDQSPETRTLLDQLQKEGALGESLSLIPMTEGEARKAMENGSTAAIVTIPPGFTNDLRHGENRPIHVMTSSEKPLASSMVTILLESGARYISAAQSGVNTVYHLYIKALDSREERSELLQQVIIQFTLFALNRDQLFFTEKISLGATVGWIQHGVIALMFTGFIISSMILQTIFNRTINCTIQERLIAMNVGSAVYVFSQFLLYLTYFSMQLMVIALLLSKVFTMPWLISLPAVVTCLGLALATASILSLTDIVIASPSVKMTINAILFATGSLLSGILIPEIYLPEWMNQLSPYLPWTWIYQSFETIITDNSWPLTDWAWITLFALILLVLSAGYGKIKEGKYGSVFFPSG
ncbi:ABC-type multidrug transport system permease subunit [Melghiribacillus thermohalophilus]|uniref:ABC-type multidrug transport system permease subunit n=1 Tax=Melghiribacillus thermohalophilus TaxID=1324956 RepID=A0A4R3MQ54_9BACI|nr:ABC transporter permease [Melghiribacillus thermohalophilus]TCT18005.1 ABC-type multidrug transport system permease subunit [Melghiribacillus thermohalophilus]